MKKKLWLGLTALVLLLAFVVSSAAPVAYAAPEDETEVISTGFSNDESVEVTQTAAAPLFSGVDGFKSVAKSDQRELLVGTFSNGLVLAVKDTKTGNIAYSVSPKASQLDDKEQSRALSFGIVTYVDRTGTSKRCYTGSAFLTGDYETEDIDNGVRYIFKFTDEREGQGFEVPFTFRVVEDRFEAAVELKDIVTYASCTSYVASVALLPYFGGAEYGEEGYMLIPDGCGTLIANDYSSRDGTVKYFETFVYGYDSTIHNTTTNMHLNHTEKTTLPVFGCKGGDQSMFAVIGAGDALSMVKAVSSREAFPFTSTYAEFLVNKQDSYTDGTKTTSRSTSRASNTEAATVSYYMLNGEKSDYVGMAACYREVLRKAGADSKVSADMPFYMDIVGAIRKSESVLGFVVDVTKPITTFAQTEEMVNALSDSGVKDINVRYLGWLDGGMEGPAVTDVSVESKLGGEKGLKQLMQTLSSKNGRLFLDFELIDIYSGKMGWSTSKVAVRDMVSSIAVQNYYKLNIGTADPKNFYYHVRGDYVQKQIDGFLDGFQKLGVSGISVGSLGDSNYSDFYIGDRFRDAYENREYFRNALSGLEENVGAVIVDGGNGYTLPYVDTVIAPPMYDSGYEMSMTEVPFIQIALHGLVTFTETAHNLNSQPAVQFLRQLETGAVPYYILTGEESSEFLGTNMNYVYTSQFETWKETAVECYKTLSSILNGYCDKPITAHKVITPEVRYTVYNDDLAVLVNYGDADYNYGGVTIPAEGYTTLKASALPVETASEEVAE